MSVLFNVREFGATGNGVTDDVESINDAIARVNEPDEHAESILLFPPGCYAISASMMRIRRKCHVMGAGAFVRELTPLDHVFGFSQADGSSFAGLTCLGAESADTYQNDDRKPFVWIGASRGVAVRNIDVGSKTCAVELSSAHGCVLHNVFHTGVADIAATAQTASVYVKDSDDALIDGLRAIGNGNGILFASTPRHGMIRNCVIADMDNNGVYLSSAMNAIVENTHVHECRGNGIKTRGDGNRILNCIVRKATLGVVLTGRRGGGSQNGVVSGCHLSECPYGAIRVGDRQYGIDGVQVTNNAMLDCATHEAYEEIQLRGRGHSSWGNQSFSSRQDDEDED